MRRAASIQTTRGPSRRGFTALEVLMATALGATVLLAAAGLFTMMDRAGRMQEQRLTDAGELSRMHAIIRRAMQSMVSKDGTRVEQDELLEQSEAARIARNRGEEVGDGEDGQGAVIQGAIDQSGGVVREQPRFILAPQIPGRSGDDDPRRLELVLRGQPAPGLPEAFGSVRGAFELAPSTRGYALVWQPIRPAGDPLLLIDGVEQIRWTVLVPGGFETTTKGMFEGGKGGWEQDTPALYTNEFPKAVRLQLRTVTGKMIDWMFEPAVSPGPDA